MYGKSTLAAGSAGGAMVPFLGGDVVLTIVAALTLLFAVLASTKLLPARQA